MFPLFLFLSCRNLQPSTSIVPHSNDTALHSFPHCRDGGTQVYRLYSEAGVKRPWLNLTILNLDRWAQHSTGGQVKVQVQSTVRMAPKQI